MKRLYVAYGSNLNLEQMKHRCPTATIYGKGKLHDYKLFFKGMDHNAFLTIEPCKGSIVPVALWDIEPEDEKSLDRYEGYPSFYYKEDVEVELDTGEMIRAMVYIMALGVDYNEPSPRYHKAVTEGYQEFGFDTKYIEEAVKASITRKS